jgi:hypothetical protein
MPRQRTLPLTPEARAELEDARDHDPKAYIRMRARALLLVADGKSACWVARQGLERPMSPDRVYYWLNCYEAEGIAGLTVHKGRGRKPAYFPAG